MKPLNKTLFLLILPLTILVADSPKAVTQLDFSSLVDEFMNEENSLKRTINLSGKQRMLTQLMTKLSLQIEMNIQKDKSLKKLKQMADLYDSTLKDLKKTTSKKVLKEIASVEQVWTPFYKEINKFIEKKNKKSLKYIIENNEALLKISNELVKVFEATNTSENYLEKVRLRVVNIAGRQRMLTQKMTKEKLLIAKGEEYARKLKETMTLFDDSLKLLIKGDSKKMIAKPSNEKIVAQLNVVSKLWNELKPLYEKKKNSSKELAIIILKNPILLKEMNSMVQMAEKEVEY